MKTTASGPKIPPLAPHSRVLRRASLGNLDGRSREGRFLRDTERKLVDMIGGSPSFGQKLLITRAARAMLRLQLLDEKLEKGNWGDVDAEAFGALNNSLRGALRELGIGTATQMPTARNPLAEHFAKPAAGRAAP
jgi:hypothetical protein